LKKLQTDRRVSTPTQDPTHELKKKAVPGKWMSRIVNFMGFKKSAKNRLERIQNQKETEREN